MVMLKYLWVILTIKIHGIMVILTIISSVLEWLRSGDQFLLRHIDADLLAGY